ncbi:Oidioi.mRNA.OKI2018_I69.chr2.g5362.t1.cds [Oikopleura dioica]|uniref:Oidioi.mRNA.OKI2018_I69.chr2.g5362.t1.cds n=1 Tax=Oikopleura dioica TaxID=34765 RepID=A0ABN7T5R3_OIKDI|nr:Oidioi.mRNA.OKI2018_I69.chr2.g5362.t1.cds [Oikopleura dioica]
MNPRGHPKEGSVKERLEKFQQQIDGNQNVRANSRNSMVLEFTKNRFGSRRRPRNDEDDEMSREDEERARIVIEGRGRRNSSVPGSEASSSSNFRSVLPAAIDEESAQPVTSSSSSLSSSKSSQINRSRQVSEQKSESNDSSETEDTEETVKEPDQMKDDDLDSLISSLGSFSGIRRRPVRTKLVKPEPEILGPGSHNII